MLLILFIRLPYRYIYSSKTHVSFPALTGCEALTEWEYLPPVGPRPPKGFVGLKNAGATCYMNSVIQQLYMIPAIRNGILAIEGTGSDVDDDMSGDEKQDNEVHFNEHFQKASSVYTNNNGISNSIQEYDISVLFCAFVVFATPVINFYFSFILVWGDLVNFEKEGTVNS